MANDPEFPRLERLGKGYRSLAVLFLNTVIVFVVLNLLAYPFVLILNPAKGVGALSYGMETLREVYPGFSEDEIKQLLEETWSSHYIYEPFTQFKEGIIEGKFVNTDPAGFRLIGEQAGWPPEERAVNVFVFGGSTTFGYGVPDSDTIPSYLQAALRNGGKCGQPLNVYNFGRANYYSTQERILFEQILAKDVQPDIAIFIDGLNEFFNLEDEPKFTDQLSYLMTESNFRLVWRAAKKMPILALFSSVGSGIGNGDSVETTPPASSEETLEAVIERYLTNKRLIENVADEYGVQTFFVWQPVPTYKYNTENDVFYSGESGYFEEHVVSGEGYSLMAGKLEKGEVALNEDSFLWLGDLQDGRSDPLYVDRVHYTGEFSGDIAEAIAEFVDDGCS